MLIVSAAYTSSSGFFFATAFFFPTCRHCSNACQECNCWKPHIYPLSHFLAETSSRTDSGADNSQNYHNRGSHHVMSALYRCSVAILSSWAPDVAPGIPVCSLQTYSSNSVSVPWIYIIICRCRWLFFFFFEVPIWSYLPSDK